MAERWAAGAYQRGHLYMFPNQATGRFGYSFVNYPGVPAEMAAARADRADQRHDRRHSGHGGFYPRWEVIFKNGFISRRQGGGAQGEALKEFLHYPGLNELTYPVPQRAGLLVPLRDRVRFPSERVPQSATDARDRQHAAPSACAAASSTGASASACGTIRMRRPNRRSLARVHEEEQRAVRSRLAHAHLLHDLQGAAAQREQVGEAARQGAHDEPRQPRGARARVALRRSELPAHRGLDPGSAGHQRPGRLPEGLRAGSWRRTRSRCIDKANKGTYEHYFPGAGQKITYSGTCPRTAAASSSERQGRTVNRNGPASILAGPFCLSSGPLRGATRLSFNSPWPQPRQTVPATPQAVAATTTGMPSDLKNLIVLLVIAAACVGFRLLPLADRAALA